MTYKVTENFLKVFGLNSIKDLPELPKYKLDSNRQIVIDDLEEEKEDGVKELAKEEKESPSISDKKLIY